MSPLSRLGERNIVSNDLEGLSPVARVTEENDLVGTRFNIGNSDILRCIENIKALGQGVSEIEETGLFAPQNNATQSVGDLLGGMGDVPSNDLGGADCPYAVGIGLDNWWNEDVADLHGSGGACSNVDGCCEGEVEATEECEESEDEVDRREGCHDGNRS